MARDTQGTLPDPDSSLWAHLAHDLRHERLKANLSLTQIGKILGIQKQAVNAREHNRRKLTDADAKTLDTLFVTSGRFTRILRFARAMHDPDWLREHVEYEQRSTIIRAFELANVPGVFQTPDYARALIRAGGAKNIDALVEMRLARQKILDQKDPPTLWALIDESVIRRRPGGATVMRAQLARLLELAERPNISVRVIPYSSGEYPGQDGAFKIMHAEVDVVFVEAPGGGRLVLDSQEITRFGLRFDRCGHMALPEPQSLAMIKEAM